MSPVSLRDNPPEPTPARRVRLFKNGANQAVRIPKEFELPGQDALLWREGHRLVLQAAPLNTPKGSSAALLAALEELAQLGPLREEPAEMSASQDLTRIAPPGLRRP
jgi:antitoxin VapB